MRFADIIGHQDAKEKLRHLVHRDRVPHAMILLAKQGSGGLPLALAYMSYIFCLDRTTEDSCGQCSACNKTHKFIHPDVHFSFPVVKFGSLERSNVTSDQWLPTFRTAVQETPYMTMSKWTGLMDAGDTQPNINVKECNDIRTKLGMMTYESDKKFLIMWLPEYLGNEGNRLLKLIEEPTDNTYIVLVAENQDRILKTILSRCQTIPIKPLQATEIAAYLESNYEVPAHQAVQIANLAQGDLQDAIDMCTGDEIEYSDQLINWLRTCYALDPSKINDQIQSIAKYGKNEQRNFLEYTIHFLRQFIFWDVTKQDVPLTEKEMDVARKLTSIINIDKAERISNLINDAVYYLQRNANVRILLYADSISIGRILREK